MFDPEDDAQIEAAEEALAADVDEMDMAEAGQIIYDYFDYNYE